MERPGGVSMIDIRMIPEFDGSSLSAHEWLRKAESACRLCGVNDVARMIGLRLTGAAFEVYDQMAPEDQGKLDKVRERLLTAFAPDPFIAYDELITRRLRDRETADAFLAALRQLALPAGGVSERVMTSIFVRGLPEQIQDALRAGARMETLTLDELLSCARAMLAKGPSGWNGNLAIVAASSSSSPEARVPGTVLCCYACGGPNHFARDCMTQRQESYGRRQKTRKHSGKRRQGGCSGAGALPSLIKALPSVWIQVDGVDRRALVDSGCTSCVVHAPCCRRWSKQPTSLYTISGDKLRCAGVGTATLELREGHAVEVDVIVSEQKPLGFDLVLGIHAIQRLGGMFLDHQGDVLLGPLNARICASAHAEIRVEGAEFVAAYEPTLKSWKAAWKWANGCAPTILHNTKEEYPPAIAVRPAYEKELTTWIQNGWLIPYDEQRLGPPRALIPLMAVIQRAKGKVRPVLDFRELNGHIDTFTANSDVCANKIREWRRRGTNVTILDLRKAYLQIRVEESLWPYQTVMIHGRRYCLTRLGFGLNVAPSIMKAVVDKVLSLAPEVSRGSSAYLDDIFVDESVVNRRVVSKHLAEYGLESKTPESVWEGARVLGLNVWGERNMLRWKRGTEIAELPKKLTRRTVFSYCGELVGHYPVCGWLRVASAFVKREANSVTSRWDEPIHGGPVPQHLDEMVRQLKEHDPVQGRWDISGTVARIWVDASMLALGAALEVDGEIVEDGTWLRPDEARHINMAELDAVIKGLNLALTWKMKTVELMTDSATVHRWIEDGLLGKARLKTKAANEMLIRRRIETVLALVREYQLSLTVTLVRSIDNKADRLTRVPNRWIARPDMFGTQACAAAVNDEQSTVSLIVTVHHEAGHPGVRRTLYFARRRDPRISKREVRRVLSECDICKSIDPAPAKWKHGVLEVPQIWQRVGVDVTHYGKDLYLTMIDCGPSRFAIWRLLIHRSSVEVARHLESVFYERGAPEELLTDNDTAFRSREVRLVTERWGTRLRFRCAYAPSGNGITERCHRTIKVIAARTKCSIQEAVHRYNLTPRDDRNAITAPANAIHRYILRDRNEISTITPERSTDCPYSVGDAVWVRPHAGRCDSQYCKGLVTRVISDQAIEINGMPRHVRDVRRRNRTPQQTFGSAPQPAVNDPTEEYSKEQSRWVGIPTHAEEPVPTQSVHDQRQAQTDPRRSTRIRQQTRCRLLGCRPADCLGDQEGQRDATLVSEEEFSSTRDLEIRRECSE
uniref:Uncharacterized protein n=1 Tax=Trichuris muris TaxID=70415 RepID=A0A5S6QJ31_TRIMR